MIEINSTPAKPSIGAITTGQSTTLISSIRTSCRFSTKLVIFFFLIEFF